jgi:hypothetical protein
MLATLRLLLSRCPVVLLRRLLPCTFAPHCSALLRYRATAALRCSVLPPGMLGSLRWLLAETALCPAQRAALQDCVGEGGTGGSALRVALADLGDWSQMQVPRAVLLRILRCA